MGPNISKRWPVGERTVLVGEAFEPARTTAPERNNQVKYEKKMTDLFAEIFRATPLCHVLNNEARSVPLHGTGFKMM